MHITDSQSSIVSPAGIAKVANSGGYSCDDSYAYKCSKVLMNPSSLQFLNSPDGVDIAGVTFGSVQFRAMWKQYVEWLDADSEDFYAWRDGR
jgi:hypothetical protein